MNHYFSLYFSNFFSHPERHARLIHLTRFILCLLFSAQEILEAHNHVHTGYTSLLTIICLQIIYLFCLFTNKTPSTLGFLHLLTIFFRDMTNQNAQEKIHLNSLRYLVLFSVQNYPIMICLICALLYYGLHVLSINRGEFQAQLSMEIYTTTLLTLVLVLIIHHTHLKSVSQESQNAKKECEKLKKQIKDLSQELQKIKEESKQAAQSQDLFVACVSHEFRNPLNILLGNIDILYSSIQDPNQIQILNLCKICGDSLLSQINNLLDVAKINMGKLDIHELPTKMSSFLNEFWNAMKHNIENKGLTGNLMIDRNFPLWINIDNHRLRQILYNILDNAIKFTSKGSIKVKLSWQQPLLDEQSISPERESLIFDGAHESSEEWKSRKNTKSDIPLPSLNLDESNHISFNTQEPIQTRIDRILANAQPIDSEGSIRIDIVDTGCGIPISAQKRIFDSFVQGDRTITRSHGGIGVGLYIAKSLVKAMNGEITLESKLGKGTHIKILIPVTVFSQAEVFPSEEQLQQEITTRKRKSSGIPSIVRLPPSSPKKFLSLLNFPSPTKTVLIVDDNQFNQKIMESYFKTLQIDAEFACNGLQGLQMYQDNPDKYFLITMDIQMPVMDGITACKYIRSFEKRQSRKKIPLIIVSGNCNESEMKECLESKEIMADYFFRKPFGLEDCKMCVQKILNLTH
jgi:signal transduction histidine kinase/ActR/RegA family two-component response regulator